MTETQQVRLQSFLLLSDPDTRNSLGKYKLFETKKILDIQQVAMGGFLFPTRAGTTTFHWRRCMLTAPHVLQNCIVSVLHSRYNSSLVDTILV